MEGLFSLHLRQVPSQRSPAQHTSTFSVDNFLSAPRKQQAHVALTIWTTTTPAQTPHPSMQREWGMNQSRLQWSAQINAAWWEE